MPGLEVVFKKRFILFYVYVCVLPVCMYCTTYVLGTCRGEKRLLGPLELELQVLLSHHVGAGDQIWVLWKSGQGSLLTAEPPFQPPNISPRLCSWGCSCCLGYFQNDGGGPWDCLKVQVHANGHDSCDIIGWERGPGLLFAKAPQTTLLCFRVPAGGLH